MSPGETLLSLLQRRIRNRGRMTFRDFMAACLYEPGFGRYAAGSPPMGPEGDYITSPEVDVAFGRLCGRAVAEAAGRMGAAQVPGEAFKLIEMGPGKGTLCRDLLAGLAGEDPALFEKTVYVLVEPSALLRREQKELLAKASLLGKVVWKSWADLRGERALTGGILANEFLDALPVHLVEGSGGRVREVYVALGPDGLLVEELGELSDPRIDAYFDALGAKLREGQRAEVNLEALRWIREAADVLDRGFAIVVDYGHEAEELHDERHEAGTLLGYRRHTVVADPLAAPGENDLTSHLDFTSLRGEALRCGFEASAMTTQRNFLVSLGLAEEIAGLAAGAGAGGASESARRRFALHSLMSPSGMGETFKVLVFAKGLSLEGLRFLENPFRRPVEARTDGV